MEDDLFAVFGGEKQAAPAASTSQLPAEDKPSKKDRKRKRERQSQAAGSSGGAAAGEGEDGSADGTEDSDKPDGAVAGVEASSSQSHKKQKQKKSNGRKGSASSQDEHEDVEPVVEQDSTSMAVDGSEERPHSKGYRRKEVAVEMAEPLEDQPLLADDFQQEAHVDVAVSAGLQGSSAAAGSSDEASGKITLSHQVRHQVALPPNYPYIPISQHKPPPVPARIYPFELDPFQKVSVASIQRNESVLVSAHTSAGKTVVAEYAIAQCLRDKQRVIYTSPIKVGRYR